MRINKKKKRTFKKIIFCSQLVGFSDVFCSTASTYHEVKQKCFFDGNDITLKNYKIYLVNFTQQHFLG